MCGNIRIKPEAHDTCFPAGLLAGLGSYYRAVLLALTASQLIRWQDSNPASNPAGKQTSCAANFRKVNRYL